MEKIQVNELRSLILEKIAELSGKKADLNVDLDGDESDEVQGNFILSMAYDYNDRNNTKLNALHSALNKIDKLYTFGECEECGEDIEYKRLKACPEAKYCIKCAEIIEKENRLYRG